MKKLFLTFIAVVFSMASVASQAADNKVTIQLKWVTQAQFAGYYVAQDKGFYTDEGLEVTILPGGPDVVPPQVMAGGAADVMVDWAPSALAAREKGLALVNIAQPFKSSGLLLVCRKDSGIAVPADLKDKTVGVWFGGNEYPLLNWMSKLNIPTDGSAGGVTLMKQGYNVDPLLQKQADCVSAMAYNEYWQVIDAGLTNDDLTIFNYTDLGVASLEDGLYVMENKLSDPNFVNKMAKFVRASMKGWAWARENNDAAADIVLENDDTGAQTEAHQRRMMGEINKLTAGSDGSLVEADFNTTVDNLMSAGADAVISKRPIGAWSAVITNRM